MKKDAILINTARGPVVNETDLIEFLISNKNFQVGLDVFENEPNVNEEFKNLPNVVMTPHISSAKESARVEMAFATGKNILEALAV
jgi:glyoxylate reductase